MGEIEPIRSVEAWKRMIKRAEKLHREAGLSRVSQKILKEARHGPEE